MKPLPPVVRQTKVDAMDVHVDMWGLEFVVSDGFPWYITPCCEASATGTASGIACRACYEDVDPGLGGFPEW